jgi:hypothetical protein
MQQPQATTYADIAEVRAVTGAAGCNQLLAEGWVLLGIYPITTVAEMGAGQTDRGHSAVCPPVSWVCSGKEKRVTLSQLPQLLGNKMLSLPSQ